MKTYPALSTDQRTPPVTPGAALTSGPRRGAGRRWTFQWAPYILLAPFIVLFGSFLIYPAISSVLTAFQSAPNDPQARWVGLTNFVRVFEDPLFIAALGNTAFFMTVSVLVIFPVSLGLALLVHPLWVRGQAIFRVLLIVPAVVAPVVSVIMFQIILGMNGVLNSALRSIFEGYESIDFFNDPTWSRWTVALIFVWRWTGFTMIYFAAGLASVSRELEEAATVDGANAWQRLWAVIWPQLQPIRILVLLLVVQGAAQIFDEPKIVSGQTGAGPGNTLISLTMYVYTAGFGQGRFGPANAAALILMVCLFVISALILLAGRDNTRPRKGAR